MAAGQYVEILERRQGLKICCPEEIAFLNGFLTREQLLGAADRQEKSSYGAYLRLVAG